MTVGTLAVIAASHSTVSEAETTLARLGAASVALRRLGSDRELVFGQFADHTAARLAVADLRRQGWAAVQRPADDDAHLFAWQNHMRAVSIAEGRLLVCMPWAECERDTVPVVEIDPGGAFGTGTHPSTRLLLDALATRLQGGETVLDVGCGSGVLAIATVRLGAATAVAIDIEEEAIAMTRANAARNGLAARITAMATPLQELTGSFEVIVANLSRDLLIELAAALEARLAPGGWLGLSGISPAQVSLVAAAFSGLRIVATPRLDDWSAILGISSG